MLTVFVSYDSFLNLIIVGSQMLRNQMTQDRLATQSWIDSLVNDFSVLIWTPLTAKPLLYHCKDFPETLEVPIRGRVCSLTLKLGKEARA